MSRTDDDAAARARLERVAWGAASTPAEAVRARMALADLDREARGRARTDPPSGTRSAPDTRPRADPAMTPVPTGSPSGTLPVGSSDGATPGGRVDTATGAGSDGPAMDDDEADRGGTDRRGTGLLGAVRRLVGRARRTDQTVLWALGGGAVVVGLVVGTGVGLSVGTSAARPATTTVTPAAGTVTVEQMLDLPQTFADQLPGSVEAPVSLRTTRLVFTNRSLSGEASATPWNVWAGVGRDGSTVCLVATADRIEGTSACYPREDALHGTVSLSATSLSGTLWVRLVGGAVRGTVTSTATSRTY
ncbi:hypothetical protein [Curtobacterium sp. MCBD17_021]|uniref:hypothetical protein n=1 Tax=Curtobacterium sp. MCBD17_021 TaxID=2175665 RepID=UPI000DA88941|nr:hypothetical protein [Curtobacterium sp. MCBD17_021]PZE67581.1 hypothetical protein DEI83_05935 [Curtobacterium sp. MCBD17_021]